MVFLLGFKQWKLVLTWCVSAFVFSLIVGVGYYLDGVIILKKLPPDSEVPYYLLINTFIEGVFYGYFFGPGVGILCYLAWRLRFRDRVLLE
jgi:hypothetical protein